jgi:hypothetical protein
MVEDARQCKAITKAGQPCKGTALPGDSFCFAHSPSLQGERASGRYKGGKGKATTARLRKLMPADLRDTFELLQNALCETYAGNLEPRIATAMGSLASAMCRVLEAGELVARLDEIEDRLTTKDGEAAKWPA